MLCFHPILIKEPRLKTPEARGKFYAYKKSLLARGFKVNYIPSWRFVPCNDCVLCRARNTAEVIGMLYAESHKFDGIGYFCTLTLSDEYNDGSVHRSQCEPIRDWFNYVGIRYYLTSEYGSSTHRPHYHSIIFGPRDWNDAIRIMNEHWKFGCVKVDPIDFARIRYVANAHVNKCSHVPYLLDDDVFLPAGKNFVMKSRALGADYLFENVDRIYCDGFWTFNGIRFPLTDTLREYMFRFLHLDKYEASLLADFGYKAPCNPDVYDYWYKLAKKLNYDLFLPESDVELANDNMIKFSQYAIQAEIQMKAEFDKKYIHKSQSVSSYA